MVNVVLNASISGFPLKKTFEKPSCEIYPEIHMRDLRQPNENASNPAPIDYYRYVAD